MIPKTKLSESEYQAVTTSVVQLCYCVHLYSKGSESMFLKFVAHDMPPTLLGCRAETENIERGRGSL